MELAPLEAFQKYAALGPDFLTWLFVRVMETDVPSPPSEPGLKVDIKGPLLFASDTGDARKIALTGDDAPTAPEVLAALRQGKRLVRAKLELAVWEDTYKFTLDAETFDLKSIKLPVPTIADANEFLSMRVQSTMRLYHLMDEMFEVFLRLRLDPAAWKAEAKRWKKLAGAGGKD